MNRRARTGLGMMILLLGLFFYIAVVSALAAWAEPMPFWAQVAFYGFFGVAWIFPGRWLLKWIGRAPADEL
ncbi:MAG: hypothetical protein Tsb0016_08510 [Sphingomonadales bacterium]